MYTHVCLSEREILVVVKKVVDVCVLLEKLEAVQEQSNARAGNVR